MGDTYSSIFFHCIWGTKKRHPFLIPPIDTEIHDLIKNIIEKNGGYVLAIGGMPDHVHVLLSIKPATSMAILMQQAKGATSRFIRESLVDMGSFSWQNGYGIFSIRHSDINTVTTYIKNQAIHHNMLSFEKEYHFLLRENGLKDTK